MNYPNGQPYKENKSLDGRNVSPFSSNIEYGGRGMTLEKDIEQSKLLTKEVYDKRPLSIKFKEGLAKLISPIL